MSRRKGWIRVGREPVQGFPALAGVEHDSHESSAVRKVARGIIA